MKYECPKCGYKGKNLTVLPAIRTCCVGRSTEISGFVNVAPKILEEQYAKEKIGQKSILCPKCHMHGFPNFKIRLSAPKRIRKSNRNKLTA